MSQTNSVQDKKFLADIKKKFVSVAGEDKVIDQNELQKALGIKDAHYASRIFSVIDDDKSGEIDLREFLDFVENLVNGDEDAKLSFTFKLYDADCSGSIEESELGQIITASLNENGLEIDSDLQEKLTHIMFAKVDTDNSGTISFDEYKDLMDQYPDLKRRMTVSAAKWLTPEPVKNEESESLVSKVSNSISRLTQYVSNNPSVAFFLFLYAVTNVYLFLNAVDTYAEKGSNTFIQIARGGGAALNFNGMLILVPMLRILLTKLRATILGKVIPFDESIEFHKLIAHVMMVMALVHTTAHLLNYSTLEGSIISYLLTTNAALTGSLLLIVFSVMWVGAQNFVRQKGHFEVFYFTHLAFVLWFVFILLHGPVFWIWAAVPISLYLIEWAIRFIKNKKPVEVRTITPLPSGVTAVELNRPDYFKYQSGDYLFIKLPAVSKHEWHPFTITSCPEETDKLSVHVRGLGNWTKRLHEFAKTNESVEGLTAHLDGPYGTPSTHIFESRVAVMIGAGIGVTPFASILKSIFMSKKKSGIEKVHFYWMNRDQYSFEWFASMLMSLRYDNDSAVLDTNVFLTGVKLDMKSTGLDMAMDIYLKETGKDLLTGLPSKTNLDRPNWDQIFAGLAKEHEDKKVDVYFCGPLVLSKILGNLCVNHGFSFRKENF